MTRVSGLIINRVYPDIMGSRYVPAPGRGGCSPAEARLTITLNSTENIPETGMAQHRGTSGSWGIA